MTDDMGYPEYGSPQPDQPEQLDPVKAHAALCAAMVLQGKNGVDTYHVTSFSKTFEMFLRDKR